jgi:hypothetical protein
LWPALFKFSDGKEYQRANYVELLHHDSSAIKEPIRALVLAPNDREYKKCSQKLIFSIPSFN